MTEQEELNQTVRRMMGIPTVDPDRLERLFRERYNILTDLKKTSTKLAEAVSREDNVSIELELQIRQDYIGRAEQNWNEILELGESDPEAADYLRGLVLVPPDEAVPQDETERKILDLRRSCLRRIEELKQQDRAISYSYTRDESYYRSQKA